MYMTLIIRQDGFTTTRNIILEKKGIVKMAVWGAVVIGQIDVCRMVDWKLLNGSREMRSKNDSFRSNY